LDNAKDDRDNAGDGPADKDAECDTEKGPEEPLIGKEAAAIVVGRTRIEAAGLSGDERNKSSGSEKSRRKRSPRRQSKRRFEGYQVSRHYYNNYRIKHAVAFHCAPYGTHVLYFI
jgi:hypothetical protein